MRCPDCGHVLPDLKPEIIVKKEPCKCGVSTDYRIGRLVFILGSILILSMFGGCWITHHYNSKHLKPGETLDPTGEIRKIRQVGEEK